MIRAFEDENVYRRERRQRKATAIAWHIYETARQNNKGSWGPHLAEAVENLRQEWRNEWAKSAGQSEPSEETWELVVYYLGRRVARDAHPAQGALA